MKTEKKQLNNTQLELTIRVTKSEAQPWLSQAAIRLSTQRPIKGFRPGKAPYEIVKKEFGENALIQEALEDIVNGSFGSVLETEKINTFGRIGFDLIPALAPDEVVSYKAIVTLMPTVKLGDWQSKKIKRQEIKVTDEELNKALDEFATMLIREEVVNREAKMQDKVIVDFEVSLDGKVIDGGSATDFGLILGEGKMIPGFEEKIVGSKAGQKLEFKLNFPADYYAKGLSGKEADFKINVKQVVARVKPELDDELAKKVGTENLVDLKKKLGENLSKEKQQREEERVEIEAIKQLTDSATFTELPQEMIGETAHDLVHEFEHTLAHQGMKFDQYLQSINKKEADLIREFEPKAIERIKSSMALGQLAEDEKLVVTPEELDAEIKLQKSPDADKIEYRRHVANQLINRKLIEFLKQKLVQ